MSEREDPNRDDLSQDDRDERWEMTGEGALPAPDTELEPRMDGDGAHPEPATGSHPEMTGEGAVLEPDEAPSERMTAEGSEPVDHAPGDDRRVDR
jgi:hypothetical protein